MRVNGCDSLALTKLDVLDPLAEIPVCVGYRHEGKMISELPTDMDVFEACEPVYETLPGWKTSTLGARDYNDLPPLARAYVERLAELVRGEIGIVSTGPERNDTLMRSKSALASWFT
jgi:adenylosuccinate synthase